MFLPQFVKDVMQKLEDAGRRCYLVGGSVRNFLLGLAVSDYDITTSATPDEVKSALYPITVIETGLKHGTVTAVIDKNPIEITTFRREGEYLDHRRPQSVSFSRSIDEDLSRRDFTVNALAMDLRGNIIDLFGGRRDLDDRILKAVGDADARFKEDALRILRALRFSACLKFSIEEKTAEAIERNAHLLSFVSRERIYREFCLLICGENASEVLIRFKEVFFEALEVEDKESFKKGAEVIEKLPQNLSVRLAALFWGKKTAAHSCLRSLKADNKTLNTVLRLCQGEGLVIPKLRAEVKLFLAENSDICDDLAVLLRAFYKSEEEHICKFLEIKKDIESKNEAYLLRHLKIGGSDLIALGVEGKEIGKTLQSLLKLVIFEKLQNDRESLIEYIKSQTDF